MKQFLVKLIGKLSAKLPNGAAKYDLVQVYQLPNGVRYFGFANPALLPTRRFLELETAKRMLEMNLTPEALADIIQRITDAINKADLAAAAVAVHELKLRSELKATTQSLLQIAAAFFVREGEDPATPNQSTNAAKIAEWNQYPDALDFFLREAWSTTEALPHLSLESIRTYLGEADAIIQTAGAIKPKPKTTKPSTQASKPSSTSSIGSTSQPQEGWLRKSQR